MEHRPRPRARARRCRRPDSAGPSPSAVNRSPAKSVRVVSSYSARRPSRGGRAACRCSARACRRGRGPRRRPAPAAAGRRGRSSETSTPMMPCATSARGATASHWFIAPHSSASTWPKVMQRSVVGSGRSARRPRTRAGTAGAWPVWNSSGSSATTRYWLKGSPTSGMKVEIRWMPSAISCGGRFHRRSPLSVWSRCGQKNCVQSGSGSASRPAPGRGRRGCGRTRRRRRAYRLAPVPRVKVPPADAFELEDERLVEIAGPFGDHVGDDAAVVLGGEFDLLAGRTRDVDAVHPHVTRVHHVHQVADGLLADRRAHVDDPQLADGPGDAATHLDRARRGCRVPVGDLVVGDARAVADLDLVDAVDPVVPADLLEQLLASGELADALAVATRSPRPRRAGAGRSPARPTGRCRSGGSSHRRRAGGRAPSCGRTRRP